MVLDALGNYVFGILHPKQNHTLVELNPRQVLNMTNPCGSFLPGMYMITPSSGKRLVEYYLGTTHTMFIWRKTQNNGKEQSSHSACIRECFTRAVLPNPET